LNDILKKELIIIIIIKEINNDNYKNRNLIIIKFLNHLIHLIIIKIKENL
jgi:hypothetical protein